MVGESVEEPEVEVVSAPEELTPAERCKADIKQHLATVGGRGWEVVQARHPGVSSRQFWRYVQAVRGTGAHSRTYTPDPETLRGAIESITVRAQTAAAKKNIPHPPSPAIIAAGGIEARKKLDFLLHIEEMLADCNRLRSFAIKVDDDGAERVHNPLYFSQSIKMRAEVLNTAVSAMKVLWDIQRMTAFYDLIVAEVAKCDPDTGRRLMERLQELDDAKGMTLNARM